MHVDELQRFREGFVILQEAAFKVEMYLYLVFDCIAKAVSEWIVQVVRESLFTTLI